MSSQQKLSSNYVPVPPTSDGQPSRPPNGQPSAQQVVVIPPLILGPQPTRVTCPSCHWEMTTRMELDTSMRTHLAALLLCLAFFPLTCLPYCMDECQSKNHYCTNCGCYLGTFQN